MKNKILLATINAKKALYTVTADDFSAIAPNVQMGLLAEYIKSNDIDIDFIEADVEGIDIDRLIEIVVEEKPRLFGVICTGANPSSSTMSMVGAIDFYKKFNTKKIEVKRSRKNIIRKKIQTH